MPTTSLRCPPPVRRLTAGLVLALGAAAVATAPASAQMGTIRFDNWLYFQ
jgi:hypothetical protein